MNQDLALLIGCAMGGFIFLGGYSTVLIGFVAGTKNIHRNGAIAVLLESAFLLFVGLWFAVTAAAFGLLCVGILKRWVGPASERRVNEMSSDFKAYHAGDKSANLHGIGSISGKRP
jgi:hypothetical protein